MNGSFTSGATTPSAPKSSTKTETKPEVDQVAIATHQAIKELDGKNLYDRICIVYGIFVIVAFLLPPVNALVRATFKGVGIVAKATEKTVDYAIPNMERSPQKGDKINGYNVTSDYGPRNCTGCSKFHRGIDLGTPVGTPVYAIGEKGETVVARCRPPQDTGGGGLTLEVFHSKYPWVFVYLHLSKCSIPFGKEVEWQSGTVIALTGGEPSDPNAGTSTGPHLHFGQIKNPDKKRPSELVVREYIPPYASFTWWSMAGDKPKPTVSTGGEKNDT